MLKKQLLLSAAGEVGVDVAAEEWERERSGVRATSRVKSLLFQTHVLELRTAGMCDW